MDPTQRILIAHLQTPEFLAGSAQGWWGHVIDERVAWPHVLLWVAAPVRPGAPARFHVRLNFEQYPTQPPTGNIADPASTELMAFAQRPKGRAGSRFARVMRTDWEHGRAFYHPYDRVAASSHPNWTAEMPRKHWTSSHTVTHWLSEFHALFHSEEYVGV